MNKKYLLQKTNLWLTACALFGMGLCIPKFSQALIYPVLFFLGLRWKGKIVLDFALQVCILILFSLSYYVPLYSYGIIELPYVVHRPFVYIGCYILGYSLHRSNIPGWPSKLILLLLAGVAGLLFFNLLLLVFLTPTEILEVMATRTVDNFWNSRESAYATVIGLYASLGLCLIPVPLFTKYRGMRIHQFIVRTMGFFIMTAIGLYSAIIFQGRAPILAAGISLFFCTLVFIFSGRKHDGSFRWRFVRVLLIYIFFFGMVYFLASIVDIAAVFKRFAAQGVDTPRFATWQLFLRKLPQNLFGGRDFGLGGLQYVHNCWLDVAYDAGIIPMFFLLAFHFSHFRHFLKVMTSRLPLLSKIVIAAMGISFAVGFSMEPVLSGSVYYFSISCFFLGVIRRLSRDINALPIIESSPAKGSFFLPVSGVDYVRR